MEISCATTGCGISREILNKVKKDPQRITKILRTQSEKLDWSGISFPMKLTDMSKFEKENENIAVNVLAYSEASIYPLRISKEENRKYVINLLLLVGARPGQRLANDEKKHYCLMNNISRLLSSQASRVLTQVSVPLLKQRKACTP